jgi:hypothetical protein
VVTTKRPILGATNHPKVRRHADKTYDGAGFVWFATFPSRTKRGHILVKGDESITTVNRGSSPGRGSTSAGDYRVPTNPVHV